MHVAVVLLKMGTLDILSVLMQPIILFAVRTMPPEKMILIHSHKEQKEKNENSSLCID
jgi:hypothetical protein